MHCLRLCLYRKCYGDHVRENIQNTYSHTSKYIFRVAEDAYINSKLTDAQRNRLCKDGQYIQLFLNEIPTIFQNLLRKKTLFLRSFR